MLINNISKEDFIKWSSFFMTRKEADAAYDDIQMLFDKIEIDSEYKYLYHFKCKTCGHKFAQTIFDIPDDGYVDDCSAQSFYEWYGIFSEAAYGDFECQNCKSDSYYTEKELAFLKATPEEKENIFPGYARVYCPDQEGYYRNGFIVYAYYEDGKVKTIRTEY